MLKTSIILQQNKRLSFSILREFHRNFNLRQFSKRKVERNFDTLYDQYQSKLLYNSVIESKRPHLGFHKNAAFISKLEKEKELLKNQAKLIQPLPISLKYIDDSLHKEDEKELDINENEDSNSPHFPYASHITLNQDAEQTSTLNDSIDGNEVRNRYNQTKDMKNWMEAYENFSGEYINPDNDNTAEINYGTPDPNSKFSKVPCGGCGAFLHCKDTSLPGYIPSEIFKNTLKPGGTNLEAIICQRCYFLKNFNTALQVRVSPDDYPKILTQIRDKKALVILMVDLLDFPCSIWPGIADILEKIPIIVVGNKVDLIPKDSNNYMTRIKKQLMDYCRLSGFGTSRIFDVVLISAATGYGVEDLITSIQRHWRYRGDVYLVGCTNVGKSTLFNALLKSDYCKVQASDLIQRATTSEWPGTTLNLLKFPIMRLSGYRTYLRHARLEEVKKIAASEEKLRSELLRVDNSPKNATLFGHIGQSYTVPKNVDESVDSFGVTSSPNASGIQKMGIFENHKDYALCKWCYDTPGVVQTDQIIHLLTAEELILTLPKHIIRAQTFCVKPGSSLFIAGLARLDYLNGPGSIRLTVFRSNELPLTICNIEEADEVYKNLVGTELFKVPLDGEERLEKWPGLEVSKQFKVVGTSWDESCKDIVLSSAGWVAINCAKDKEYSFQAWTPEKRGCVVRDCLLPNAVKLRGRRIRFTPAYKPHKFI